MGQDNGPDVIDYNRPPIGQPSLWCRWIPNINGDALIWDGSEKFYEYVPWLEYLIYHFLRPWGYSLTGSVTWQGEDSGDLGIIGIINCVANQVSVDGIGVYGGAVIPNSDMVPVKENLLRLKEKWTVP